MMVLYLVLNHTTIKFSDLIGSGYYSIQLQHGPQVYVFINVLVLMRYHFYSNSWFKEMCIADFVVFWI